MKYARASLLGLSALLLASCTVGPKYSKPVVPSTPAYKEQPPNSFKEAGVWQPAKPGDDALRGKWWEIFSDPHLNSLEEQAETGNLSIQIEAQRFLQSRAAIRFDRASQYPTISTGPSIDTLRLSANRPNTLSNASHPTGDFVLPLDVSYEVDLWGRVRRTISAAREEAQATAGDLATAGLSIHAELAIDYFELRSLDAREEILSNTVKAYAKALQLTRNRYVGGVAAKQEVAQAQTQLNTTQAQATDIGALRAQYEHAIAVLIGKPPASFTLPAAPLKTTPPPIPVGVPSELLERRPDIASAERRLAEANDRIGIAKAAFYPTLTLSGSAGLEGHTIVDWFTWPSRFWAAGPGVSQILYDSGRRRAVLESAAFNYDATVANYRQTTLTAFQQVEDNLAALRVLETEAQQQRQAVESSQNLVNLSFNRYKGGVDTYLQVITSQTIDLNNQVTEIDILRRRMDASVLLIKALGGGWDTSKLPTISQLGR
jgi:NodT family efflux transporter outer membrane factor (OMF) lipoprotein